MDNPFLQIKSLNLTLGKFSLKNINLHCKKGEYHALLGPTGSGKSSLMRCILGFHKIDKECIYLKGIDISKELPECRSMGYVPQNYALFPHINVEENIRFGHKVKKGSFQNADDVVNRLCDILKIQELRKRNIKHLSGGEKQKVALARALAIQPDILLLDEPFSSIDDGAKRNLWIELKEIINEIGITAIHITHNLEEAYTMGERLSVLMDGELLQSESKQTILERPKNEDVARFLNYKNIFQGVAELDSIGTKINIGHFNIKISKNIPVGKKVTLCVRQQDIKIISKGNPVKDSLRQNLFSGKIISILPFPEHCLMLFKLNGSSAQYDFELKFPRYIMERQSLSKGKQIRVALLQPNIILLSNNSNP